MDKPKLICPNCGNELLEAKGTQVCLNCGYVGKGKPTAADQKVEFQAPADIPAGPVTMAQQAGSVQVQQVGEHPPPDNKTLSLPDTDNVLLQYLHELRELLPGELGRYIKWILLVLAGLGFLILVATLHLIPGL